jgi:hypothetical protein
MKSTKHVVMENGRQLPATLRDIRRLLRAEAWNGVEAFEGAAVGHRATTGHVVWLTAGLPEHRNAGRRRAFTEAWMRHSQNALIWMITKR